MLTNEGEVNLINRMNRLDITKPWFLYLIECQDGSIYTGITVDVDKRYAAHKAGKGAKYMRSHPPKRLLKVFEFANRSEASKAECKIKKLPANQKRAIVETMA
ncbi:MAG: GIY-YIG nuclease family protein [Methylophilaceae bacterium]|nr:GIY-YIG nuclease family protein [Methylophilaceae bacterium]MDG1453862.1 GIY-YIG nuclease family protein [Methylophilaceae bacterium]